MRALVTGADGFVGQHLQHALRAGGARVLAWGSDGPNVTEPGSVLNRLRVDRPDVIFHLAGQSSVSRSWRAPAETFAVNAGGTAVMLGAACELPTPPRIMLFSTGEVYGRSPGSVLLRETSPPRPASPYAISKMSAEQLLHISPYSDLELIVVRLFNQAGPGQGPSFFLSAIAQQIVAHEAGMQPAISVGNLRPVRDFLDVRDGSDLIVRLMSEGRVGDIYNVCSGVGRSLAAVVEEMIGLSPANAPVVVDETLFRPADIPELVGDGAKATAATGWTPRFTFTETLTDILTYWRRRSLETS